MARWRRDGMELFYRSGRRLMAVAMSTDGNATQIGEARQVLGSLSILGYDVSPDGQRFLVELLSRKHASQPLTVVQNWTAALKK